MITAAYVSPVTGANERSTRDLEGADRVNSGFGLITDDFVEDSTNWSECYFRRRQFSGS